MSSTENFLEQFRQAGKMDSVGNFTLNSSHQFPTLQLFQNSSECLLRLVQAAVASASSSLEIRIGVRAVELIFDPSEEYSVKTLLEQIVEPQERGWEHLTAGLKGALKAGFSEIRYTAWSNGEAQILRVREGLVEETDAFAWPWATATGVRIKLLRTTGWFSLTSLRSRTIESAVIARQCRFCPIEVRNSGFMVNQPKTHFKLKHSSSTILEAVLRSSEGEPYLAGPTPDYRWTHAMRGDGNKLTKAEFFDENEPGQPFLFLTLNPEQKSEPLSVSPLRPADVKLKRVALQKCKVVVGYGQFAYDKTRIIPVIDGVCCAPILSEDIPGSLEFHVALDRPKTDISGLRLVLEDEELDAVVNDLAVLGETVLERLDESPFAEYAPVTWLEDFVDEASALS